MYIQAAEALGAIGNQESISVLSDFLHDESRAVRETCQIAIDRIQYEIKKKNGLGDEDIGQIYILIHNL